MTNKKSFENLNHWYKELTQKAEEDVRIVLVGNKIDLGQEKRVIQASLAKKWAKSKGMQYFECSALNGSNLDEAFQALIEGRLISQSHERKNIRGNSKKAEIVVYKMKYDINSKGVNLKKGEDPNGSPCSC